MKNSLLIIFLFFCITSNSQDARTSKLIQCAHAQSAIEAGNFSDALGKFESIIGTDSFPEACMGAAYAAYYMSDFKKANLYLKSALNSKNSEFRSGEDFKKAIRLAASIEQAEGAAFDMVLVRGGTFVRGCIDGIDVECEDEERPSHYAETGDFYISKYEVTQKQWKKIMGTNPSFFNTCEDCPVESITWDEIQVFLEKLNKQYPAMNFRLPNEKEWEFAARGGKKSKSYKYCGSNKVDDVSWYDKNAGNKTHPVGKKAPNELGLYDMGGNVWEWTSDWFYLYAGTNTEPSRGLQAKSHRTDRGGCWQYSSKYCTPATRGGLSPVEKNNDLGFRLARDVD